MPLALDAMGGDFAPEQIVLGAVEAARELKLAVTLVGDEERVRAELAKHPDAAGLPISVVHASQVIEMAEHPVNAVRQKKDSSMAVAARLVKSGQAAAFVTMGNTGAAMATALFELGRIEGVERPALATILPTAGRPVMVVDLGANTNCRPSHLVQFALMGNAYMEKVFGVARPRVALLSNGEEDTKGSTEVQAAHAILKTAPINFIGNVEGRGIPQGSADVVACDGFVGNVVVKLTEGLAESLLGIIRAELTSSFVNKLAAAVLRPAFRRVRDKMDYAAYGGAPLLGVNGVVAIGHGRSNARAVKNALRLAQQSVDAGLVDTIAAAVASFGDIRGGA